MKNNIKLPFGLINGQLKHIDDVANGRACGCICPGCKQPLEARNAGKIKAHYFAHYNTDECKHGTETAIHLMAKQIIYETKTVETPLFFREPPRKSSTDGEYYYGKQVKIEPKFVKADYAIRDGERKEYRKNYRPDVTLIYKGRALLIEIKVTHAVDKEKYLKVKENNETMLEIDLSDVDAGIVLNIDEFKNYVIHQAPRHWINYPRGESYYEKLRIELDNKVKQKEALKKQREALKRQEREKYVSKLKELKSYLYPYWQNRHEILLRREIVNFPIFERITKIKEFENTQKLKMLLIDIHVKDDWIFRVHRSVWQATILTEIIFNNQNKKTIQAWEVEKHISSKYSILSVVKELSNLKREYNKAKRVNDKLYQNTIGCWFLSEQEIKLIPSPFKPIIEYLNYLSILGIIKPINNNIFSIIISTSKQYLKFINEERELKKIELEELRQIEIAREEEIKRKVIALEQERIIIAAETKKKMERLLQIANTMEHERTKEIIASEKRVFNLFNGNGRLCTYCYFFHIFQMAIIVPFVEKIDLKFHLLAHLI